MKQMNCENRKDELSEHCEFLARKQISKIPKTLVRQITRAKNMIHYAQERLIQLRTAPTSFQVDLSDDGMKRIYEQICNGTFTPAIQWQVGYCRVLLEYNWLGRIVVERRSPSEILIYAAKRAAAQKSLELVEHEHRIKVSERWKDDCAEYQQHVVQAEEFWINDLKDDLRSAVATELHWLNTLHKHGHSRSNIYSAALLLMFSSRTRDGRSRHPTSQ